MIKVMKMLRMKDNFKFAYRLFFFDHFLFKRLRER